MSGFHACLSGFYACLSGFYACLSGSHACLSGFRACFSGLPIIKDVCATSDSVSGVYKPLISEGSVSLLHDNIKNIKIKILRDTGASHSLLLADVLLFSEKSYSGESVLLQGVECGIVNVSLHNVFLTSELVSGPVTVGVRSSLPIDGVHFLLGYDLAG